jgi:hypothetical protein
VDTSWSKVPDRVKNYLSSLLPSNCENFISTESDGKDFFKRKNESEKIILGIETLLFEENEKEKIDLNRSLPSIGKILYLVMEKENRMENKDEIFYFDRNSVYQFILSLSLRRTHFEVPFTIHFPFHRFLSFLLSRCMSTNEKKYHENFLKIYRNIFFNYYYIRDDEFSSFLKKFFPKTLFDFSGNNFSSQSFDSNISSKNLFKISDILSVNESIVIIQPILFLYSKFHQSLYGILFYLFYLYYFIYFFFRFI